MSFELQQVNECIKLNETWKLTIEFFEDEAQTIPEDLTGRDPRVQVRVTADATTFLLDLTDGSGLIFTPLAGKIEINVDTSTGITVPGNFVWALELRGPENEEPIFGDFVVEQDTVR